MTFKYYFFSFLFFLFSQISLAHQTVAESSELIPSDNYRFGFETQFGSSSNLNGFGDVPINESSQLRVLLGFGDVDFYTGASYKWIPFPDFQNQPAMGFRIGTTIGREGADNFVALNGSPLISKKYETPYGLTIPYLALPITSISYKSKTTNSFQLVVGSEFNTPDMKKWGFGGELGLNIKDAQSYIAFFATILMDETIKGK